MKLHTRLIIVSGGMAAYLGALRFVVPPDQPYFILGIGIVSLVSWFLGTISGLLSMLLLIPLTTLIYKQFPVSASYVYFASSPAYIGLQVILAYAIGHMHRGRKKLLQQQELLVADNNKLQSALLTVKELGGVHHMCSGCKQIQDDEGQWHAIDTYLKEHTKIEFSHGICPDCGAAFQRASENLNN
ncbi:hypothetical protein P4B35_00820 [Pontiellaceae bacterium B12227]|nr:hypothetical protein [Pontiellaceae bacterium B12227]